jgi:hypothetical protein
MPDTRRPPKDDFVSAIVDHRAMSMFRESIFGRPVVAQRAGVRRDNELRRTELRLGELALAFVCSEEANDRWKDAVAALSEKPVRTLGALVDVLGEASCPFALRPLGNKATDSALLRANLESFLRELLWDAARISAGTMTQRFTLKTEVTAAEHDAVVVLEAARRALSLSGAHGWGFEEQAAILAGLVLEIAGLSKRRTTDDVDGARSAAVRRAVARAQRRQR